MKRGWKIFWIVCAACLAVGLVCCAASFAMGVTAEAIAGRFPNGIGFGMDHDRYSDDNYIGDVPMDDDYADDGYDNGDYDDGAHHPDVHHDLEDGYYETEEPGNVIEGS